MDDVEEQLMVMLGDQLVRADGFRLSRVLMSRFPCLVGRIDWRMAREVVERQAPSSRALGANESGCGFQTSSYVDEVVSFFGNCTTRHGITDEWVAFVGDSMDAEYEVKRSAIPALFALVADLPDHKYIFGLDGSWCLMWSFEDNLYFGLCP
jgi:hypothetical protein